MLRSGKVNYWTGEQSQQFEQRVRALCRRQIRDRPGQRHGGAGAGAARSGRGAGDEVVAPSRTFIASRELRRAARRDAGDCRCRPRTARTLPPQSFEQRADAAHQGDHRGAPCRLALRNGRDSRAGKVSTAWSWLRTAPKPSAHATKAGPRRIGDIGAFSFCQDKIITTGGEGGMLVTDRDALVGTGLVPTKTTARATTRCSSASIQPGFRWLHESFGTNWRHHRNAVRHRQAAAGEAAAVARRRGGAMPGCSARACPRFRVCACLAARA